MLIVGAFLLVVSVAQEPAPASASTHEKLAERFVIAATPEPTPSVDSDADIITDALVQANPGREADARRIAHEMSACMSRDGNAAMRQAAIEAALAFDNQQLERLISFVEMQNARQMDSASNRLPAGWEAAREDYGRWMYSIGGQPSAIVLAERCANEMATRMAAAGLRD